MYGINQQDDLKLVRSSLPLPVGVGVLIWAGVRRNLLIRNLLRVEL